MMAADPARKYLQVDHLPGLTVVNFTDRTIVDEPTAHVIGERLARLAEEAGRDQLLLNLGNVEHMSSVGLSNLISCQKKLQAAGGRLVLCNLNPTLDEVLRTTRLSQMFDIEAAAPAGNNRIAAYLAPGNHLSDPPARGAESRRPPVVLCDPRTEWAGRLVAALQHGLSVVHLADLCALADYCRKHTTAAVAIPMSWAASGAPARAGLDPAVAEFLRTHSRQFAVVVYGDTQHTPLAVYCQALAAGARQVINESAPEFADELRRTLTRLVRDHGARVREEEHLTDVFARQGLIGCSPALREVFARVLKAAYFSDLPVLILGETGTGKQLVAQAIHRLDPRRRDRPFLTLNCSAVSKTLAESALFGHTKGAFSGAAQERLGLFRAAEGGTLLLDEIGELDLEMQPKLLRVLQERRLLPVGADLEHAVDVRIIAATNRPLAAMVAEEKFRQDLYQRLNVFQIRIPPLRERPEDVEPQARHFLAACQTGPQPAVTDFGPHVLQVLRQLPWEGNTRQLENVIREALAHKEHGQLLQVEDLPRWTLEALAEPPPGAAPEAPARPASPLSGDPLQTMAQQACERGLTLHEALAEYERRLLQVALEQHGGNRTRTAKSLGLTPRSVFEKIRKYRLAEDESSGSPGTD
jgi:anti-anti-sigma factor